MMSVKNHQTPPTMRPERDLNMNKIMHIFLSLKPQREKERRQCYYRTRHYVTINGREIICFLNSNICVFS